MHDLLLLIALSVAAGIVSAEARLPERVLRALGWCRKAMARHRCTVA